MTPVFVDTSFYFAIANPDDVAHKRALQWAQEEARPRLLTEFVLLEVGNGMSKGTLRDVFLDLVQHVRQDPGHTVDPVSSDLLEAGIDLFRRRPDKEWSLTDCISFLVMEEHGLNEALTADKHFEQAGFKALLR